VLPDFSQIHLHQFAEFVHVQSLSCLTDNKQGRIVSDCH
jgi:hypothetical protein